MSSDRNKPELGSEAFTRWATAVWPYCVGVFGMILVVFDATVNGTVHWNGVGGAGLVCMGVIPYKILDRFHKG